MLLKLKMNKSVIFIGKGGKMYPFYVDGEKVFSFSYNQSKGVVKDDDAGNWYKITEVEQGRGRKVYGKETIN
ncbi:hypothetical protein [Bacillus cereus]|uniref:hypothetical protein n=2 Tax=Bacillus cereus group TaxID=86661 RepID=UPI000BFA1743|nr:hypothetical protein [Bacillus cereus]PER78693.1 hypothetical protein CN487_24990 [Bacillus cereus]